LSEILYAQNKLSGRITDAGNEHPVASATVYLSKTKIGTITNNNGEFIFQNFPNGNYNLIVPCLGFETFNQTVNYYNYTNSPLNIKLIPKIKDLPEVIVESFDRDGWKKWGDFFIKSFIGATENAKDCKI
jgi:hypothetical protein